MTRAVEAVLAAAAIFAGGWWLGSKSAPGAPELAPVRQDTVVEVRTDTVRIESVAYRDRWLSRVDTVRLASVERDTVLVEVPMESVVYEDSLFRAQVSGFRPTLDWAEVYPRTEVRVVESVVARDRRWSFGLQAGVGVTPRGVQPYVGIGVALRLSGRP